MSPLCSNNNPYASFGATLARDEEQNLWSTPHDVTHTEADDDRVLYNMIVGRSQLDKDSEVRRSGCALRSPVPFISQFGMVFSYLGVFVMGCPLHPEHCSSSAALSAPLLGRMVIIEELAQKRKKKSSLLHKHCFAALISFSKLLCAQKISAA